MSSNKKVKRSDKGTVGFYYNGIIKTGNAVVFWCEENDPQEDFNRTKEFYGEDITCRYVNCENPENAYGKFTGALSDTHLIGKLYSVHASTAVDKLKETTGESRSHTLKIKIQTGSEEAGSDDEAKKVDDSKPTEQVDEDTKSKKKGKKTEEESKPKKKVAKKSEELNADDNTEPVEESKPKKKAVKKSEEDADSKPKKKAAKKSEDDEADSKPKKKVGKKSTDEQPEKKVVKKSAQKKNTKKPTDEEEEEEEEEEDDAEEE